MSTTKERPILFNGEMVRAILEGRKWQTRRLVTPAPPAGWDRVSQYDAPRWGWTKDDTPAANWHVVLCRCGFPGDRLWVRETWANASATHWPDLPHVVSPPDELGCTTTAFYRASFDRAQSGLRWRPSIHMPRWASRILLEVTNVRVERLQDISEEDARKEGVSSRRVFRELWDQINGKRAPWLSNPWVWVVDFGRLEPRRRERP